MYPYSVSRIFQLKKLLTDYLSEFEGQKPTGKRFERFVQIAYETLPTGQHWQTLEDSLKHLVGTIVTKQTIEDTAWRLAGNVRRLRHRKTVTPWYEQRLHEWVPLQVMSSRHRRNNRNALGALLSFRVLAGTSCPMVIWKWWSLKQCRYYASYFGFSRFTHPNSRVIPRYPYEHPAQLTTLRLYGLIDPKLSIDSPGFDIAAWPTSVNTWNKEQIKHRFRLDAGYTCPKNYLPTFPCHRCPVGYLSCRAGTHRMDWVTRLCTTRNKPDAMFDPEIESDVCVDCRVKTIYKGI